MNNKPDKLNNTTGSESPEAATSEQDSVSAKRSSDKLRFGAIIAVIAAVVMLIVLIAGSSVISDKRASAADKEKADLFAQNLTDTLTQKSQERVEKQFWKGYTIKDSGIYEGLMFDITDDYSSYGPSDENFSILGKDGEYELPSYGDVRRYSIVGAKYDGNTYDVSIEYDPSDYESSSSDEDSKAYNANNFPDTKSLSSDSTAIINPESAYLKFDTSSDGEYEYDDTTQSFKHEGSSLEQTAVDNFYAKYTTFYENAVSTINSYLTQNGYDSSHMLRGSDFIQSSAKEAKESELKKSITRDTTLLAYESGDGVAFRSNIVFTLTDVTQIGIPQTVTDTLRSRLQGATITEIQADGTSVSRTAESADISAAVSTLEPQIQSLWNDATSSSELQEQFVAYQSDNAFSSLDNIYLMYYPLKVSEWEDDTINIDISAVRDRYKTDGKLNLYIVPQLGLLSSESVPYDSIQASDYIAPDLKGGTITYGENGLADNAVSVENSGTLYDMARIRINYIKGWFRTLAAADTNDSVVAENDSQDIIYNLTVGIYESSGGKFSDSDLITTREVSCS
ncbi:MAG: hypothetical protein ACOYJI_07170 [Anaerovoracaceae bacterium]|jgi:hypothetical protein